MMEFIFSKWQLNFIKFNFIINFIINYINFINFIKALNFIKFKNELFHNQFFRILLRFLMAASEREVSVKGVYCIPKLEFSCLNSRQNV